MVAGARAFPRGCAGTRWNQQTEAKMVVAAPLRYGHRSVLAGGAKRRRSRTHYAAAMQGTRRRAKTLQRISNSP
jgi:hypothetical protein